MMFEQSREGIRVYVIDDHPVVLSGFAADIRASAHHTLVGTSSDPVQALQFLSNNRKNVDVVITDIEMPVKSGLDVVAELKREDLLPRCIFLTYDASMEMRSKAIRTKADGMIYKSASIEELLATIDMVHKGVNIWHSPPEGTTVPIKVAEGLTPAEMEVLFYIACKCLSSAEVADQLHRSRHTIETHRKNIMSKLDIHTVQGLVHYAYGINLCRDEHPR